ncbi:uncharacterized protein LOC144241032 [Crocuta crocuta]
MTRPLVTLTPALLTWTMRASLRPRSHLDSPLWSRKCCHLCGKQAKYRGHCLRPMEVNYFANLNGLDIGSHTCIQCPLGGRQEAGPGRCSLGDAFCWHRPCSAHLPNAGFTTNLTGTSFNVNQITQGSVLWMSSGSVFPAGFHD